MEFNNSPDIEHLCEFENKNSLADREDQRTNFGEFNASNFDASSTDDELFFDYESCFDNSKTATDQMDFEESDKDGDRIGFSKLVDFEKEVMFRESGLCVSDVLFMILGFCLRFSLSYTARDVLVNLVKCLAEPKYETWFFSKYMFSKPCDAPDSVTLNFFLCKML